MRHSSDRSACQLKRPRKAPRRAAGRANHEGGGGTGLGQGGRGSWRPDAPAGSSGRAETGGGGGAWTGRNVDGGGEYATEECEERVTGTGRDGDGQKGNTKITHEI